MMKNVQHMCLFNNITVEKLLFKINYWYFFIVNNIACLVHQRWKVLNIKIKKYLQKSCHSNTSCYDQYSFTNKIT